MLLSTTARQQIRSIQWTSVYAEMEAQRLILAIDACEVRGDVQSAMSYADALAVAVDRDRRLRTVQDERRALRTSTNSKA
jgi:hypothetical protein